MKEAIFNAYEDQFPEFLTAKRRQELKDLQDCAGGLYFAPNMPEGDPPLYKFNISVSREQGRIEEIGFTDYRVTHKELVQAMQSRYGEPTYEDSERMVWMIEDRFQIHISKVFRDTAGVSFKDKKPAQPFTALENE